MNPRIRILAVVAGLALLAGGFYKEVLAPKRHTAAQLQTQIAEQQDALSQARQLLATNQKAKDSYRDAYAAVVRLGKAVPADDDVRSLVVQLDAAAHAAKVDFRTIDVGSGGATTAASTTGTQLPPGATVGPAGFPIEPFQFAFKGSFFRLGDFFRRLENFVQQRNRWLAVNGRLLTLDSLSLSPDTTGFPQIRATVGATSYLVPPLEGLTAGATAAGPAGTASAGSTSSAGATPTPAGSSTSTATTATATTIGAVR